MDQAAMDTVVSLAKDFGNKKLAGQLGYLSLAQQCVRPACTLQQAVVACESREESRITDGLAKTASQCRVSLRLFKVFCEKNSVADFFEAGSGDADCLQFVGGFKAAVSVCSEAERILSACS
eukprot:7337845-Alexandrium_andersonii.AAC.1